MQKGVCNLKAHLDNIAKFGIPAIVAINHFGQDSQNEIAFLESWCDQNGVRYSFVDSFEKGGEGAIDLAEKVDSLLKNESSSYAPIYNLNEPLKEKISVICKEIYHAGGVCYSKEAEEQLAKYEAMGFGDSYICMAKTPSSFSDDPNLLGAPSGFLINIREVRLAAGSRFVIPLTGKVLTLPGLPKVPAAVKMEDLSW